MNFDDYLIDEMAEEHDRLASLASLAHRAAEYGLLLISPADLDELAGRAGFVRDPVSSGLWVGPENTVIEVGAHADMARGRRPA